MRPALWQCHYWALCLSLTLALYKFMWHEGSGINGSVFAPIHTYKLTREGIDLSSSTAGRCGRDWREEGSRQAGGGTEGWLWMTSIKEVSVVSVESTLTVLKEMESEDEYLCLLILILYQTLKWTFANSWTTCKVIRVVHRLWEKERVEKYVRLWLW